MKIRLASFYKDLTPGYIEKRITECPEINNLIKEKNTKELESKFHKIAGSGGGYGIQQITEIASKIEEAAGNQDINNIEIFFKDYQQFLNNIELIFSE